VTNDQSVEPLNKAFTKQKTHQKSVCYEIPVIDLLSLFPPLSAPAPFGRLFCLVGPVLTITPTKLAGALGVECLDLLSLPAPAPAETERVDCSTDAERRAVGRRGCGSSRSSTQQILSETTRRPFPSDWTDERRVDGLPNPRPICFFAFGLLFVGNARCSGSCSAICSGDSERGDSSSEFSRSRLGS
jgi:hypothetical protein